MGADDPQGPFERGVALSAFAPGLRAEIQQVRQASSGKRLFAAAQGRRRHLQVRVVHQQQATMNGFCAESEAVELGQAGVEQHPDAEFL